MRQNYSDIGIIIKTQDYKEADKIITQFTQNHGLVSYFAVGARRNNSKKAPHLDLMSHIKFSAYVHDGQSSLIQADSLNYYSNIKKNLKKIGLAISFLEIVYNLLPAEVEDEEIYSSLVNYLEAINNSDNEIKDKQISAKFGSYLIRHLGYPPPPASSNGNLSSYFEILMNKKIIGKEIG